jgi:hypothetical protein
MVPKVAKFHEECMEILRKYGEGGQAMAKASNELTKASAMRLNENHLRFLIREGINLFPDGEVPEEALQKARQEVNLEQVVELVEQLAAIYEKYEEVGMEGLRLAQSEFGFLEFLESLIRDLEPVSDEVYARLVPYLISGEEVRKEIKEFKKKFGAHLQLLQELNRQQMKQLIGASGQLWDNVSLISSV